MSENREPNEKRRDENEVFVSSQRRALLWVCICCGVLCLGLIAVITLTNKTEEISKARFDQLLAANKINTARINLNPKSLQKDIVGYYSAASETEKPRLQRFHAKVFLTDWQLSSVLNEHAGFSKVQSNARW